jgi:hypothetical protein
VSFPYRILPAPKDGGFRLEDYWVWCGSVVQGEDGRFHMFASRWPKAYRMSPHWLFGSEIVRASSDTPEGPYRFEEVVLARRDPSFFDGRSQHNPSIKKWGDTYLLFYFGATYEDDPPAPGDDISPERYLRTWNRKRIGLATSTSVFGPWERPDAPLLEPRPGHWDATITTNPSAAILPDGTTYLIYKSRRGDGATLQLGVARAASPLGPYERLSDRPIFEFENPDFHVEDPYLWHADGRFHVLMKDDFKNGCGGITGEWGAGVYATSVDCLNWEIADPPKAYSRTVLWDDGTTTVQPNLERPNLLFQNGVATHLFCATGSGSRPWSFEHTWNLCLPLQHEGDRTS